MNDAILIRLKTIVERTVRPLRASNARKRKMREELLAHLIAVFDEELQKSGNEKTAFAETANRFGEPAAVRQELQTTVSWWNRCYSILESLELRPGESIPHFFGKLVLANCGIWTFGLLIGAATSTVRGKTVGFDFLMRLIIVLGPTISLFMFLFIFVANRLAKALHGRPEERSHQRAMWYAFVSLLILPLLTLTIHVGLGVNIDVMLPYLWFSCCLAPAMSVLLYLLGAQYAEEIRSDEEWASLSIEATPTQSL